MKIHHSTALDDDVRILIDKVNLNSKLAEFNLSAEGGATRKCISKIFNKHSVEIFDRSYDFILKVPGAKRFLEAHDLPTLKQYQIYYWNAILRDPLDHKMVSRAVVVGLTHYRINLPPHLYIAFYSTFQTHLIRLVLAHTPAGEAEPLLQESVSLVHLDMAISLTAFFYFGMRSLNLGAKINKLS